MNIGTGTGTAANALLMGVATSATAIGTVANGGSIIAPVLVIGDGTLAHATLTVGAANGVVSTGTAAVTVGTLMVAANFAAAGVLNIGTGGTVTVNTFSSMGANGIIDFAGGLLVNNGGTMIVNNGDTIEGFGRFQGSVNTNGGTVIASGGLLELSNLSGAMQIASGATLEIDQASTGTGTVTYQPGSPETLILTNGFSATNALGLAALAAGDRIEFGTGVTATSASLSGTTLTVNVTGFTSSTIQFQNVSTAAGQPSTFFTGTDSGTGDTFVQLSCFAEGTRIGTPAGPRPVETLAVGDEVDTALSGPTRIRWLGRRHVDCAHHPRPETVFPVRVAAGAFGERLPDRVLFLSPEHAVYIDGVLIPIRRLINGTTIEQVPMNSVTYHHIELPHHDVLFAEGLSCESYLDAGNRANFENSSGAIRLFPDFAVPAPTAALIWEAYGCARLVLTGPALDAARAMLDARAAILARQVAQPPEWPATRPPLARSHVGALPDSRARA